MNAELRLGTIRTLSVNEAYAELHSGKTDSQYFLITLSTKLADDFAKRGVIHLRSLAPSPVLWKDVQELKKNGEWNQDKFDSYYKKEFLSDILHRDSALSALQALTSKVLADNNITLICYCQNENMCHRTLVKQVLDTMVEGMVKRDD